MGRAEVGAAEGGVGGRHAGVGQAAQHKADDDHHDAAGAQCQDQHHGGDDEQHVHQLHGDLAAILIVHAAEQHAAQCVADGDQAHNGGHGGGGLVDTGLPHHAAGLGDQGKARRADGDGPDVIQPEGGLFHHLQRLMVMAGGLDGDLPSLAGRGHEVRAGRHKEEGADGQHHENDDAQHHEADTPAADPVGRPRLIELANDEAAAAKAHQQHAGDEAGTVGEPADHGAHDCVVAKAGAEAAQHAEADVQHGHGLGAAGQKEAQQEQHRADAHRHLGAELAAQQAAQQRTDAEQDHHDGKGHAELRLGPAGELGGDGGAQHAPGVHETGEQQHDHAHDGIDPAVQLFHREALQKCIFVVWIFTLSHPVYQMIQ